VCPSGAARASRRAASWPFAPGRFSTTTGWPRRSESLVLKARAAMSEAPPGAKGTSRVTGRVGQAGWAGAGAVRPSPAASPRARGA
jgi:hypothetical protein